MSESQVEPPVQIGPAAANLLRSIWRQRALVILGVVIGILLGTLLLPQILSSRSTYEATMRMVVRQLPPDAVLGGPPAFGAAEDPEGASTDALKDIEIAEDVIRKVGRSDEELTGIALLSRLTFNPVAGTELVEVSYSDTGAKLAAAIVREYTHELADKRNRADRAEIRNTIDTLTRFAASQHGAAKVDAEARLGRATLAQGTLPLAKVVGREPVVTTSGPPLSRQVMLALGLLLGLAIGAGGAMLVETAFPKIVTPSDAEDASELPLIATVRRKGVRRTALPLIDRPFSPAAEDYRRVGTALERQGLGSDIRVLAIASAEPGDGRTMLAANLAYSLARQGREVVLVSSDLRRPQLEELLGIGQGPGLAEALQDDPIPAIAMLVSINDHLLVLPAGMPSKHPGELLASKRLQETIQTLRQMGIIILDTSPTRHSADAISLSGVADATLFVAKSGATRVRSVREATNGLRRDRVRQLGVVLVGASSPLLRSLTARGGDLRDQRDAEFEELELLAPTQPVSFNARPPGSTPNPSDRPSPNGDVTDLAEMDQNRWAAE